MISITFKPAYIIKLCMILTITTITTDSLCFLKRKRKSSQQQDFFAAYREEQQIRAALTASYRNHPESLDTISLFIRLHDAEERTENARKSALPTNNRFRLNTKKQTS